MIETLPSYPVGQRLEACSVMVENPRRVLFLTGAPLLSSLTWEEDKLCAVLQPCFLESSEHHRPPVASAATAAPGWRSLPLVQPHLPTGLTQPDKDGWAPGVQEEVEDETSFLSTSNLSFASATSNVDRNQGSWGSKMKDEKLLSQYYEHSFALHEDVASSQILGSASAIANESFATEAEELSGALSDSDYETDDQLARSKLISSQLSGLKDLPNAAYLYSIIPQTMTVDLVVGIISISQPRTVKTRRGGREVELVEILVGDDSRAGFGINMWLSPVEERKNFGPRNEHLRNETLQLRPRDIVLARQVALCSLRGKVYGQSLRRGMTSLNLLYRNVVDKNDRRGAFRAKEFRDEGERNCQMTKVQKVKDWVLQFVGSNAGPAPLMKTSTSRFRKQAQLERLPNDTP